ncbi:MAG TPA: TasA family protein [Dehalococcoidia bacterium]|nr:TasA family protein [Dehalococcoidia bacterium]
MKKILISVMVIAVAVAIVAGGTMAYFSDTEKSTGNVMTAGTLNMTIADNNEGWNNGVPVTASWQSPSGWAPGETFTTGVISLRNVGSIPINYLFTTYYNYSYTVADLAKVIEVVEYNEYIPGYGWIDSMQPTQDLWKLVGDNLQPLTLKELILASWVGDTTWVDYCTGDGYDVVPAGNPAIPVGGTYQIYLVLKFADAAGNSYQGASCSFDIEFEGVQDNVSQKH